MNAERIEKCSTLDSVFELANYSALQRALTIEIPQGLARLLDCL